MRKAAILTCVRFSASSALSLGWFVICAMLFCQPVRAFEPDSIEFFEQRIRPVLVKHCYRCHSQEADEIGGALWLDSSDAVRQGGESGPAVRPGDADSSMLISAIRYESYEMPPDQPLPDEVIDDFVNWVNAGANDPRKKRTDARRAAMARGIDFDQGRQFWSFQPITDFRLTLPADLRDQVAGRLVDYQIEARLDEQGIVPRPIAEAETRLRRLAFDLTGLPPDADLRRRWLEQPSEKNWERIVDQLLDTRAYAQHWARHWMDVARYADSNGSDFNATFHDAWRYRDYLIESFDSDRSIDQMIRQQVAGDLLPAEDDKQRYDNVVATTFLMLGPKMLSERDKAKLTLDVVDEQIDSIGRAFLGMTLGCARCHDHKFDPIATEDYYALAGIFKSTQTLNGESQKYVSTWNRVELPTSAEHRESLKKHQRDLKELNGQIKTAEGELKTLKAKQVDGMLVDDGDATQVGSWVSSTYTKGYVGSGYVHDGDANKGKLAIEFRKRLPETGRYQVRFAYNTGGNRASNVPLLIKAGEQTHKLTVNQREKLDTPPWKNLGTFEFSAQSDAVITIGNDDTDGYVIVDAITFVRDDVPANEPSAEQDLSSAIAAAQTDVDELKKQLDALNKSAPPPLPQAMAPRDLPTDKIADSPVHIRGDVNRLGDVVPRGFLQVCADGDASIAAPRGSGRLELARWLTSEDNPLVARVMVNRVWMHLFGEGLVRSVDNFGSRGESPTHPELLDALAIDFRRNDWRLKPLVRRMVLSQVYQRSSGHDSSASATDPENRLLWRANRKRIHAESIRDAMLSAAGTLTEDEPIAPVANKGVLVTKNSGSTQAVASGIESPVRSVYLPTIRGNIAPLMQSLDIANPDLLVGKRPTTNVPGQTLVLVNSPEVNRWAQQTADRIMESHTAWRDRIAAAYQICLSREPSERDLTLAENYLNLSSQADQQRQRQAICDLVAAIFASTEFRMLD